MQNHHGADRQRVAVVGGGIAGLAAATRLARGGARVTVLERAREPGGRALTREQAGYRFNLGPHALYAGARALLEDLGVRVTGGVPSGYLAVDGDALHRLPLDGRSLAMTRLLGPGEKLAAARAFTALRGADAAALAGVSLAEWLDEHVQAPRVRRLVEATARLATYADAPAQLSAGAFVGQVSAGGVMYPDGGWGEIVDGLRVAAEAAGAEIRGGARVAAVLHDARVRGVRLAGGEVVDADAVVLAVAPGVARELLPDDALVATAAADAVPVEASWLDLALSCRPAGAHAFGLGIDRPLYYSEHSQWARLAPGGGASVVVARYLRAGETIDPAAVRASLEAFADVVAPGWRDVLVEARFFPGMTVMESLPLAARGGLPGRPAVDAPAVAGVFLAGDWVRSARLLAEGALESAMAAADGALAYVRAAAPIGTA